MGERAAARVDELLASHKPPPLPGEAVVAIAEILERAEATPRAASLP